MVDDTRARHTHQLCVHVRRVQQHVRRAMDVCIMLRLVVYELSDDSVTHGPWRGRVLVFSDMEFDTVCTQGV
jgi:hypothetical protein